MVISDKHKFIFIHIPKTGGTSISVCLDTKHQPLSVYNGMDKHYTTKQVLARNSKYKNYFKFCFVRNPWDWLVSLYTFRRPVPRVAAMTFTEFVNSDQWHQGGGNGALWKMPSVYVNLEHWYEGADFVGRMELLQKDFLHICKKLNTPRFALDKHNITNHRHYSTYYTSDTREIVSKYFKNVIDKFGYTFKKS